MSCELLLCLPLQSHLVPSFLGSSYTGWHLYLNTVKLVPAWGLHSLCSLCSDHPFLCSFFVWQAPGLVPSWTWPFHGGFLCPPYLYTALPLEDQGVCHFNLFIALIRLFSISNMCFLVCFPISYLYASSDLILLEEGSKLILFSLCASLPRTGLAPGGSLQNRSPI